jgi:hypothetical protein
MKITQLIFLMWCRNQSTNMIKFYSKLKLKSPLQLTIIKIWKYSQNNINFITYNGIKKAALIIIIIYKLFLNKNFIFNYVNHSYLVERLGFISYLLNVDNNKIGYLIFFLIIIINLIIWLLFLGLFFLGMLHRIFNFIKIIKCGKFIGFILINIFKILNTGLSYEDIILIINYNVLFDFNHNHNNNIILSPINTDNSHNITQSILIESDKIETSDSDSDNDSDISTNTKSLINNKIDINFNNFNQDLNLEDKYNYLKMKFYNKGINYNIPFFNWFINLLDMTDGSKTSVDNVIDSNLNSIQKIQREAQLNNLAFFRNKPFLINKTDNSSIAYPNIIPVFKD